MAEDRVQRRLAAILAADVVGYSRLMGVDEEGTLAALTAHLTELIEPSIAGHFGRVVKTTGDGLLAEFASVVDAVSCAVEVQEGMRDRNAGTPEDRRIVIRIGINLGDVIVQDGDVYGDGVNIAARLESLADPGSVCVSSAVYEQIKGKLDVGFHDMGPQRVKNISEPVHAYALQADTGGPTPDQDAFASQKVEQEIRFCSTPDGIGIAYATVGKGPPLVKTANFLSHLEFEWESPVWRHLLRELSNGHSLVRYDARGSGLSDRRIDDFTVETHVGDLEAVIDAVGHPRFDLFAVSQGCSIAITYAVRHPERVSRLVLMGGYAEGWRIRGSPRTVQNLEAMITLIREGWGQANPAFRQMVTTLFLPDGTVEQLDWFNELERISATPDNAARMFEEYGNIDVTELLPLVSVPTLVLHSRGDAIASHKAGRELASKIPGARLVSLESKNHLILEHEPAWPRFRDEIRRFLRSDMSDLR